MAEMQKCKDPIVRPGEGGKNVSRFPFLSSKEGGILLDIYIAPRASRSRMVGLHGARLKVAVTAPPVDGKANQALIEFMAKVLGVAKTLISIERGHSSREKLLLVKAVEREHVERKLAEHLPGLLTS